MVREPGPKKAVLSRGSWDHVLLRRGRLQMKKVMKSMKSVAGVLPPPHDGSERQQCVDPMLQKMRGICEGEWKARDHSVCECYNR